MGPAGIPGDHTVHEARAGPQGGARILREVPVATRNIEVNVEIKVETDAEIRKTSAETEVEAEVGIAAEIDTKTKETKMVEVTTKAVTERE